MLCHIQSPLHMTPLPPGFHFSLYVWYACINGMLFPRIGRGTAIAIGLGFWVHRQKVWITQKWGASHTSAIPQNIRHFAALSSFKSKLKTFLFLEYLRATLSFTPISMYSVCVCAHARACIIKRISRAPIYHTRWQHRALYNNTNHTHTHTHTWHARTCVHACVCVCILHVVMLDPRLISTLCVSFC